MALYINAVVQAISPLPLFAGAAGVWNSMTAQVYTIALFGMLHIGGAAFVQVFVSLAHGDSSPSAPRSWMFTRVLLLAHCIPAVEQRGPHQEAPYISR